MRGLLKIPFMWQRPEEDDESYVRLVRRMLGAGKALGLVSILIGVLCLAMSIGLPYWLFHALVTDQSTVDLSSVHPAVICGLVFGAITGGIAFMGVLELLLGIAFLTGFTSERLLVKYFDAFRQLEEDGAANQTLQDDG